MLIISESIIKSQCYQFTQMNIIILTIVPTLVLLLGSNSTNLHDSNRTHLHYNLLVIVNLPFPSHRQSSSQVNSPSVRLLARSRFYAKASLSLTKVNKYRTPSKFMSSKTLAKEVAILDGNWMEWDTARVNFSIKMEDAIKVFGARIPWMTTGNYTTNQIKLHIKGNGWRISSMAKESFIISSQST